MYKKLIDFGNYLLSKERKKSIEENPLFDGKLIKERLSIVSDADIENFKNKKNAKKTNNI